MTPTLNSFLPQPEPAAAFAPAQATQRADAPQQEAALPLRARKDLRALRLHADAARAVTTVAALIEQLGASAAPAQLVRRAAIPPRVVAEVFGGTDELIAALAERERLALTAALPRAVHGLSLDVVMSRVAVRFTGWVAQRPQLAQFLILHCSGPGGAVARMRDDLTDRTQRLLGAVLRVAELSEREAVAIAELLVAAAVRFGGELLVAPLHDDRDGAWAFRVGGVEERAAALAARLSGLVVAAGAAAGYEIDPRAPLAA